MRIKSKLFSKRSADWGLDDKWIGREDTRAVNSVWYGIAKKLDQLKETLQVKGRPLGQFLAKHPVSELFSSQDPEVKRTGYQLRSLINQFVSNEFEESVLNRFKAHAGNNVTDWLTKGKTRSKKKADNSDTGLRMHPDYGEEGSYTSEANKENSKESSKQFNFKAKFLTADMGLSYGSKIKVIKEVSDPGSLIPAVGVEGKFISPTRSCSWMNWRRP